MPIGQAGHESGTRVMLEPTQGDPMSKSSKLFLVAVVIGAVAVSACRREMPQPMGLGASEMAVKEVAVK
jgi:hypothetical protein